MLEAERTKKIAFAAIDAFCFIAPVLTFVLWTDANPFTGDVGMDRGIGACLVLILTQAGASLARRMMHIKD